MLLAGTKSGKSLVEVTDSFSPRKRSQTSALQQTKEFQALDLKVQIIIKELAQSPRSFDELKSLIHVGAREIKEHITNELQQCQRDLADEQYCQRFLDSLWYPEIHRRQETVGEAHQKTFQWIYEPNGFDKSAPRWDSIVQWFEQGKGIYWISGKAGSGKSTLMNYICQDNRTSESLRLWSGAKEVLTPRFFFWNAGSTLEKSSEGLLRSLLYQILQKYPDLITSTCDDQANIELSDDCQRNHQQLTAWTEHRLHTNFQNVMRVAQKLCHMCIFIDGLDEISGDPNLLIEMIKSVHSGTVKVCLSSRPDRSYTDAFESCTKLRLQDLTEPDIRTYVQDKLQIESAHDVSKVLDSVVSKANGVFIWVQLVVKTLVNGLQNDDSLEQLQIRVESIPSDIEDMYARMLSKIEDCYRPEAALLFQLAITNLSESLLDVALALCKNFDHISDMSVGDALHSCRRTQERIPTVCAGLLEVHLEDKDSAKGKGELKMLEGYLTLPCRYTSSSEATEISYYERHARVAFLHRTAIDFLNKSKPGQDFLEYTKSCPSIHSIYVRALLAKLSLLGFPEKRSDTDAEPEKVTAITDTAFVDHLLDVSADDFARRFTHKIMMNVSLAEWETDTAQVSLCDDVDRVLATVYQRYRVMFPLPHWCTQWGTGLVEVDDPIDITQYSRMSSRSRRSSSPASFHSTRSEPTRCETRLFLEGPVDYLGFAASLGQFRYVLEKLDLQQNFLDKRYTNYLLCCSMRAFYYSLPVLWSPQTGNHPQKWVSATLDLVVELLRRGGDPNLYVECKFTTIWGLLLYVGYREPQGAVAKAAEAFLEAGADVHLKTMTRTAKDARLQPSSALKSYYVPLIGLYIERSALYMVRNRLKHSREWEAVEKKISANGGRESYEYVHVDLEDCHSHKMSERQRQRLVTAMNEAHQQNGAEVDLDNSSISYFKKTWEEVLTEEALIRVEESDSHVPR